MNTENKRSRKWIWIGGGVVITAVVLILLVTFLRGRSAAQEAAAGTGEIVTAFIGDLSASATASGQLMTQRDAQLALTGGGEVAELFVQEGDTVTAGDPLLQLDTAAIERSVASAEQALAAAQANLAAATAPPSAADLAAAEANVASAQAAYDDLLAGPDEGDLAAAAANLRAAEANVWAASEQLQQAQQGASEAEVASAQAELIAAQGNQQQLQEVYDQLLQCYTFDLPDGSERTICPGWGNPEEQTRYNLATANANLAAAQATLDALTAGPDADQLAIAQANVTAATARREAAQANYDVLALGASDVQVAAAAAALAQAQQGLEALQNGPTEAQITQLDVQVEQARINLDRAQRQLAEATLTAPFAGVVTAVYVNPGELANGIVMQIVDSDSLEVVLEVDEVDLGTLAVGQPAVITLESWPDTELDGKIVAIAPEAVQNGGAITSYEVNVALEETDLPLLVGMTANASLTTAQRSDVLLLPNVAINADRSAGTYSVNRVTTDADGNQTIEEVEITIGLRDDEYTQITGGLNEGDQVMIGNLTPLRRFGPGGDGGGPPF